MLENSFQILGFLGWFSFLLLVILFKDRGGGFSCRKFSEMFESFLFVEGVIGSILGGGVGLAGGGASMVCISVLATSSVVQSSARLHFCSAWSFVTCVPG